MNRFALSAAGLAASTASAEIATLNFSLDYFTSEQSFAIYSSGGLEVANLSVTSSSSSSSLYWSGTGNVLSSSISANDPYSGLFSGLSSFVTFDLPAGNYTITLFDSYGDGWRGGYWTGTGGVSFSGNAVGDDVVMDGGFEVSGSFTVVPAPASLALLGLAGLTRRRRD